MRWASCPCPWKAKITGMGWEESKCSGVDNRYERVWPLEVIVWRGDCWVDGGGVAAA